jgi:hypothetical protein
MKSASIGFLLFALSASGMAAHPQILELATKIETSDDSVTLESQGYAKLNLVRLKTNHKGNIFLKGSFAVENGKANVVMWSKVEGKYYFTKLPGLQGYASATFVDFAIPFNSPEQPISEVLVDVELPNGGKLHVKNIELIRQ